MRKIKYQSVIDEYQMLLNAKAKRLLQQRSNINKKSTTSGSSQAHTGTFKVQYKGCCSEFHMSSSYCPSQRALSHRDNVNKKLATAGPSQTYAGIYRVQSKGRCLEFHMSSSYLRQNCNCCNDTCDEKELLPWNYCCKNFVLNRSSKESTLKQSIQSKTGYFLCNQVLPAEVPLF